MTKTLTNHLIIKLDINLGDCIPLAQKEKIICKLADGTFIEIKCTKKNHPKKFEVHFKMILAFQYDLGIK